MKAGDIYQNISIHQFILKSHLIPTLKILIKLKLRAAITIDEGHGLHPSRPNPKRREKIKLNFYFHTFLWYLKRFYEGLKGLHKTFSGTSKKCENKTLT